MITPAQPFTINRALAIALAIIGFVASVGSVAVGTSLLSIRDGQTEMRVDMRGLKETVGELKAQVTVGTQDRYSSKTASEDRNTMIATMNSMRDGWALSFKTLIEEEAAKSREIADIRVRLARLEERAKMRPEGQ